MTQVPNVSDVFLIQRHDTLRARMYCMRVSVKMLMHACVLIVYRPNYVCACICICMYISTHECMCKCMCSCLCLRTYISIHECMSMYCMHVCIYTCTYACMHEQYVYVNI